MKLKNIACETEEAARIQHMKTLYSLANKLRNERARHREEIAVSEPNLGEVKDAIAGLKNGKAPGCGEFSTKRIRELLRKVWRNETIPDDWNRGVIIKLPKKGNLKECMNSWG